MDILKIQDLQELINKDGLIVSIYMPTFRSGVDIRQNSIKFKQLLRDVEGKFYDMGMNKQEVESFLNPAANLIDETKFWQNQGDGLALFLDEDGVKYFRLPFEFSESVTVGDRIHLKPLFPLFNGNGQFNVLALSKNQVRLFRCTRQTVKEIELVDAPDSQHDMQVDDDPRTKLEIRTSSPQGKNQLSYNKVTQGQGNENDYERNELTRYFRAIDESLMKIHEEGIVPMVLAGVEYLIPIYREKSNYPYILEDFIRGNPELLNGEELKDMAWKIVESLFNKDRIQAEDKYRQFYGQKNKLYANSLEKIIPAAFSGQIESLFLDNSVEKWGKYDHQNNKIKLHKVPMDGDEDLMEYASILTLSRGGNVFSVSTENIPDESSIAAVLRY